MTRHEEDELSDSQRLTILEETVANNRLMLVVMLIMAVIAVSVAVTIGVVRLLQPDVAYVDSKAFSRLEQEMSALKDSAASWQQKVNSLRLVLDSSQATAFKAMMLEQEESYQLHLNALKNGMRDLARMVPGSRTWLEIYEEQMDEAIAQSKARMGKLARLQTSELPNMDAVPLQVRPTPPVISE